MVALNFIFVPTFHNPSIVKVMGESIIGLDKYD